MEATTDAAAIARVAALQLRFVVKSVDELYETPEDLDISFRAPSLEGEVHMTCF